MHSFTEYLDRCAAFTLENLSKVNMKTIQALETSGSTSLVITLQMIQLQKAIFAVGMFSNFEAYLQEGLNCTNGFDKAKKILDDENELEINERFENLILAINVLKHGRGRSYDTLVANAKSLPFKIKLPNESFFLEGDVSEVSTLVQVDDSFVQLCGDTIREVYLVLNRVHNELL
jgi:hypothetical protein